MNKITKPIVSSRVKPVEVSLADVEIKDRPEQLTGSTYKLKPGEHALYITINNVEINGKWHPYEIFINTKDAADYQWVMLFCRMASAIFKRSDDYLFLIEEMKCIIDPAGGFFIKGRGHVQSLVAEIGRIIENHITQLNID